MLIQWRILFTFILRYTTTAYSKYLFILSKYIPFMCGIRRKKNQLFDSAKTPKLAAQLILKYFHVLYFLQHEFCIFPRFHFHTHRTTTVYVCSFENRFRDALFYVRLVKRINRIHSKICLCFLILNMAIALSYALV